MIAVWRYGERCGFSVDQLFFFLNFFLKSQELLAVVIRIDGLPGVKSCDTRCPSKPAIQTAPPYGVLI